MTIILIIGNTGEIHLLHGQGGMQALLKKLCARHTTLEPALDDTLARLGFFETSLNWVCLANGSDMILVYPENTNSNQAVKNKNNRLSPRQRQILQHLSEGLTSKQIALRLGIHTNTVNLHIRMLKERLGASTRAEFVGKAAHAGLCHPPHYWP
jgi:DNA-binding NarL/FixJ family response regulator